MRPNHVKHAWKQGKQTLGGWINVDSVHVAETMAGLGFDWLCMDMQHGALDYNDVRNMLPAISTTNTVPIVRVPWNEPYIIMKALDAGAYGVIVPLVNNREEAEKGGGGEGRCGGRGGCKVNLNRWISSSGLVLSL